MSEFLQITSEDITAIIGYSSDLITNLLPLVIVMLGVFIGLYIVKEILNMI